MNKSLHLILNGKVSNDDRIHGAVEKLRRDGVAVSVNVTWEVGHASEYARALSDGDRATIVAGGGDGTLNEVINGIMKSDRPSALAALPLGTANDFAHSAGLPIDRIDEALQLAAYGQSTPVDLGLANSRYFLNVATGGIGAEASGSTPRELKKLLGDSAYAITAAIHALQAKCPKVRVNFGDEVYSGPMLVMAVGNGRCAGGGVPLTPHAVIDDGMFDVTFVPDPTHTRIPYLIRDLVELRHGVHEHFRQVRLTEMSIEGDETLQFNLDGEPVFEKKFIFRIIPSALSMILPSPCDLTSRVSQPSAY